MEREDSLQQVMELSEKPTRLPKGLGLDYAAKGVFILRAIWCLLFLAALGFLVLAFYVGSYGPLGKAFIGIGTLCLGLRGYSRFAQNQTKLL